jgi:hypothetical protein
VSDIAGLDVANDCRSTGLKSSPLRPPRGSRTSRVPSPSGSSGRASAQLHRASCPTHSRQLRLRCRCRRTMSMNNVGTPAFRCASSCCDRACLQPARRHIGRHHNERGAKLHRRAGLVASILILPPSRALGPGRPTGARVPRGGRRDRGAGPRSRKASRTKCSNPTPNFAGRRPRGSDGVTVRAWRRRQTVQPGPS